MLRMLRRVQEYDHHTIIKVIFIILLFNNIEMKKNI
jgi:hypothetical protein